MDLVMADDPKKRIYIRIPLVKRIRLFLWGKMRDLTTTEMAERIVIDRVSNPDNWDEAMRDMRQEAAIARMSVNEYAVTLLREEFKEIPVEEIDWSPILETSEKSKLEEVLKLLELGNVEEAIAYLKSLKP